MFLFFVVENLVNKILVFLTGFLLLLLVIYMPPDRGNDPVWYLTPLAVLSLCIIRFVIFSNFKISFSNVINTGNYVRNKHKLGQWHVLSIFPALILLAAIVQFFYYVSSFDDYHFDFFILTLSGFFLFGLDSAWAYKINFWLLEAMKQIRNDFE